MKFNKNVLIYNVIITTPVHYKKSTLIVNHTCTFDSVVFAIGMAYMDHYIYTNYLDTCNNSFFNFVKNIRLNGSTTITYRQRFLLLKTIFSIGTEISSIKTINADYNVTKIIKHFFKDEPNNVGEIIYAFEICLRTITLRVSPTIMLNRYRNVTLNTEDIQSTQNILRIITKPKLMECRTNFCDILKQQ